MMFPTNSRLGRIAINAAVLMLITFLLSEITLRVYQSLSPTFIFYDESYNRFRQPPLSYDYDFQLNSRGFKDQEFPVEKGEHYRILGIGDSFAFGVVPYEYNYLTLLETQLADKVPRAQLLNMGIPAAQPQHYLELLIDEGLALEPDMVLVSFFTGNDIAMPLTPRAREWHEYSYTVSLLRFAITIYPKLQRQREALKVMQQQRRYVDDQPHGRTEEDYIALERRRSHIYSTGWPGFGPRLDSAMEYLQQIRDVCGRRGIAFAVIIIPDELQVNPELQADVLQLRRAEGESDDLDFTRPNRALSKRLAASGIPTLDLTDHFVEVSRERRLYKSRDTHWNIAGNAEAAREIRNYLRATFFSNK